MFEFFKEFRLKITFWCIFSLIIIICCAYNIKQNWPDIKKREIKYQMLQKEKEIEFNNFVIDQWEGYKITTLNSNNTPYFLEFIKYYLDDEYTEQKAYKYYIIISDYENLISNNIESCTR